MCIVIYVHTDEHELDERLLILCHAFPDHTPLLIIFMNVCVKICQPHE